jgi:hypothetical protein
LGCFWLKTLSIKLWRTYYAYEKKNGEIKSMLKMYMESLILQSQVYFVNPSKMVQRWSNLDLSFR